MNIGVILPQTEIGADPSAVRDYAQAAEDLGYSHVLVYDHVIGAHIDRPDRRGRRWPYNHHDMFHEPFVLYGYLAAVTSRVQLVTGILILPQRQTVLVAKQAAEVDVLSGGRLRLGMGIGWNAVEYEALGQSFETRGARIEEQIEVLRALWSNQLVTFEGQWHEIDDAGINPLPIPVWMGGYAEPVLERIGRMADGWTLVGPPMPALESKLERIRDYARAAGRDPSEIGLEGGIRYAEGGPDEWRQALETWRRLGATYVAVNTMGAGLESPADHIEAITRFKREVDV